jgi:glycerol uptake facilitator-like aquaporin
MNFSFYAGSQPLAIGFGLIAVIYMFAPISGAQLNPAVSIGLVMRNKLNLYEAAYCVVCQVAGATFAGCSRMLDNYDTVSSFSL